MNRGLYILWHGVNEWEKFDGGLSEAIRRVKSEHRYLDYGSRGATILSGQELYRIDVDGIETSEEFYRVDTELTEKSEMEDRIKGVERCFWGRPISEIPSSRLKVVLAMLRAPGASGYCDDMAFEIICELERRGELNLNEKGETECPQVNESSSSVENSE